VGCRRARRGAAAEERGDFRQWAGGEMLDGAAAGAGKTRWRVVPAARREGIGGGDTAWKTFDRV